MARTPEEMTGFLETVRHGYNRMRARAFAGDYSGVTHAGVLIVARDSGAMLLAQRAQDPTDAPEVAETWEMPGGGLDEGEEPLAGAWREYSEEVGGPIPTHDVVYGWRAGDADQYQGFLVAVDEQFAVDPATADPAEVQNVAWVTPEQAGTLALRPEFAKLDLSALVSRVSGNEGAPMTENAPEVAPDEEPEWDLVAALAMPIPVHGVIAPEEVATGDGRGFNAGSMTRRPMRLPFSDQKANIGGHDGSVVVGSVDRMMRRGGLIHWEGALMPSAETEDLIARMVFFDGRFGVSVDGDNGNLDSERSKMTGQMWFDAVRASGLTACAIPAFHEAYVAFGNHPDMPEDDTDAVLSASGLASTDIVGGRLTFDRGPGWVTNPVETRRLHDYWTKPGQPGYEKIGWGTGGDFARAKALIGAKIAANSPEDMRFLNQIIAQWHHDALGYWPSTHAKMERGGGSSGAKTASAAPEESPAYEIDLLTASANPTQARPPLAYFNRHDDGGALVIEDPDEYGIRRTYGYAAEWGVCHIGYSGECVEPPADPSGGEYADFHLGRTRTEDGYINTGLITYKVEHRNARAILTETAEQAHFDNIENAWAAVRVGEDERGVWFSGVVLPHVSEEDIVLIEASGQVSGEWKYGAMRTCLTVGVPGYPIQRASAEYDEDGNLIALAASAFNDPVTLAINGAENSECAQETIKARMDALRRVEAESRMDALRASWATQNAGA